MKKILLLAIGLALFSCSSETETKESEKEKVVNAIVDPGDPDMHLPSSSGYPPLANSLTDPDLHYMKHYLPINNTSDSIRVTMYFLPKYVNAAGAFVQSVIFPNGFMKAEFLYHPNDVSFGNSSSMHNSDISNQQYAQHEFADHIYVGVMWNSKRFWGDYFPFTIEQQTYKPAFLEFWVKNGKYEGDHHWLALETIDNYNSTMSNHVNLTLPIAGYTLPFVVPQVKYYALANEVSAVPNVAYYIHNQIKSTTEDLVHNIRGTFRYMPNVVQPNYPIENPDTSPGYIIKFENI